MEFLLHFAGYVFLTLFKSKAVEGGISAGSPRMSRWLSTLLLLGVLICGSLLLLLPLLLSVLVYSSLLMLLSLLSVLVCSALLLMLSLLVGVLVCGSLLMLSLLGVSFHILPFLCRQKPRPIVLGSSGVFFLLREYGLDPR